MEEDNICPICYDNLDSKNNTIELLCKHKFHLECILLVYKNAKLSYSYNKKKIRKCPFCRLDGGYLPLVCPQVPLDGIHHEYEEFKKMDKSEIEKYFDKSRCHTILVSGKNQGDQCSRKCIENTKYCKLHTT